MAKDRKPEIMKHGSEGHAALLASGYGMTVEDAKLTIKERAENPNLHTIAEVRKAQAMLAAFEAGEDKLGPISEKPGWKRQKTMGVR